MLRGKGFSVRGGVPLDPSAATVQHRNEDSSEDGVDDHRDAEGCREDPLQVVRVNTFTFPWGRNGIYAYRDLPVVGEHWPDVSVITIRHISQI